MEKIKTLIIGSGPAGYTAAIYAGRANLQPVLYSGMQPGGQLTITTEVENFPGYPNGVDGTQMMMDMKEQAARFGAEMRDGSIVKADFSSRPFHLTDERDNEIEAETVIIATGASAKYLGLADEEKYRGQGVSACATCDGFFYRKRTVAVVGVAQLGFGVAKDAVHRLVHPQDVACGRHREDAFVGVVEHGPQARFTVEGLLMQGFCQTRRLPVTLCPQAQQPPQDHGAGRAAHEQGRGGGLKRGAIRRAGLPPGGSAEQQAAGEHDPGADMQPACFLFGSCDLGLHSVVSCQSHQLTFRERQASVRSSEETTSHAGLIQIDTRNKG